MVHEALSFILSYGVISTIAVGVKNVGQLVENLKASGLKMDEEKVRIYEELYDKEIAPKPLPW